MKFIKQFCEGAERLAINTDNLLVMDTDILHVEFDKDSIKRSRMNNDLSCIFNMTFDLNQSITLSEQISFMKTIELFYPDTFNWRFDGENIECYALLEMKPEYMTIYGRYRSVFDFIKQLRERLLTVIRYRGFKNLNISKFITSMVHVNGSINIDTELYVIEIEPSYDLFLILNNSKKRLSFIKETKPLNMKYWVKEMNPDFNRKIIVQHNNVIPLEDNTFSLYPPCIKNIAGLPKKGNYNRFLLATFFLAMHTQKDAKHQLLSVLSDSERNHILHGNCKDQWRSITVKKYNGPSCKTMVECGACTQDCGNPYPHFIKKEE